MFIISFQCTLKVLNPNSKMLTKRCHEGAWMERRYSSYSFSTSALDGREWSESRPGRALAPGKGSPVPILQRVLWAPEPVWTQRLEEKSFRLCRKSNLDRPVVQSVARHYTKSANTVPNFIKIHSPSMCFKIGHD
jgi:hypothetical protein